jgi:RHS repeat-associated protein
VTKFTYSANSNQITTLFPSATKDEDKYGYNNADKMSESKMVKLLEPGSETLASVGYIRDNDGQVKKTTSVGLPGAEITENTYDVNNRLTKSGSEYKYDAANNATTIGAGTYKYDKASELETGPSLAYTYDEVGERVKTKPTSGPVTTYGYDQAGNLKSIERPKEGEIAEIKDTYAYDGSGLLASQTISGTTTYLSWDMTQADPLILSDGTNSYIYGPGGLPFEQVNNSTGTVLYLHHDQAGSTRMLTSSTGTKEASFTYDAYGNTTGTTGTAKTPLGYDAQYTSTDTGLIYLRARTYDPATAQFLSVDPLAGITGARYGYAGENPLNSSDPTGLFWKQLGEGIVGWGDTLTFGATKLVREQLGNDNVNTCSGAYQAGGYAGLATGVLIPGEGEAEIGAEAADQGIAGIIRGYTQHGLEQAIERDAGRGVSPSAILDAVRSPVSTSMQADGVTKYVGQNAIVFVSSEGRVVTTFARNSAGLRSHD